MKRKQFIAGAMALLLALTPIQSVRAEGGVAVDEAHFPDVHFREYVSSEFDTNNDGVLSANEIGGIFSIVLSEGSVSSLTGMEYFTELSYIKCSGNKITNLDVSGCTKLQMLYCEGNELTNLDASGCTNLEYLECPNNHLTNLNVSGCTKLVALHCGGNQLRNLDVNSCMNLEHLDCRINQLTKLDVSKNTKLSTLYCHQNQITELNISGCAKLEYLVCENNQLTNLDVSGCTNLESLDCGNNQLTNLDVNGCTMLQSLFCAGNQITNLDVSGCANLVGGDYGKYGDNGSTEPDDEDNASTESAGTPIQSVSVDKAHFPDDRFREYVSSTFDTNNDGVLSEDEIKEATDFSCSNMGIRSLAGIEYFTEARDLACDWNQLTELDVSKNRELDWLSCNDNQLTRLDVSGCTKLTWLDCSSNKLTKLDVSGCTQLKSLYCFGNKLTTLIGADRVDYVDNEGHGYEDYEDHESTESVDTSAKVVTVDKAHFPDRYFRKYVHKYCDTNGDGWLSEREIGKIKWVCFGFSNIEFGEFSIDDREISGRVSNLAGIEYFKALRGLACGNNHLTKLDISKNTNLRVLDCGNNHLTKLDVSRCTKLKYLYCGENKLTKLNVSNNMQLKDLGCNDNKLTKLNVGKKTKLEWLGCDYNKLRKLDVSGCKRLETLICCENELTTLKVRKCTKLTHLNCRCNNLTKLDLRDNKEILFFAISCPTALFEHNPLRRIDLPKGSTKKIGRRTFQNIGGYRGKKLTFTVATKKEQQRLIKTLRRNEFYIVFPTLAKVIVRKK
ncbi:MAG: leucine-rich repeat domain-containing protein [Lachnospiraceae bacterium]|nr:leucine-rich repeat domain-containing protein [Lachnospiraceae bacterium]